jgi:hypothetical protein
MRGQMVNLREALRKRKSPLQLVQMPNGKLPRHALKKVVFSPSVRGDPDLVCPPLWLCCSHGHDSTPSSSTRWIRAHVPSSSGKAAALLQELVIAEAHTDKQTPTSMSQFCVRTLQIDTLTERGLHSDPSIDLTSPHSQWYERTVGRQWTELDVDYINYSYDCTWLCDFV